MTAPRKAPVCPAPSEAGGLPPGLIFLPVGKGCGLVLTVAEYVRGLRRGKAWKRREALRRRGEAG